jgi:hypothetical protein
MFDEPPATIDPRAIAMEYLEKHKLREIFEVRASTLLNMLNIQAFIHYNLSLCRLLEAK